MQPIIIKNRDVRLETSSVDGHEPKTVQLLRDGDVVRAIELKCSCGEKTILEIDYEASQPPNPS